MARHPLHPMVVHFPVACWFLASLADGASLYFGDVAWQWTVPLLLIGCSMALLAMLSGLLEVARLPDGPALEYAYWHMGLMFLAFTLYSIRLFSGLHMEAGDWHGLQLVAPSVWGLWASGLGLLSLLAGGYVAGELVYGHGVGRE